MIGSVYFLKNPITQEIFYIGCTKQKLSIRLWRHYQNLKEKNRGDRNDNRRFEYLENLLPARAEIHLLETVEYCDMEFTESMYIGLFKSWGFNLTNQTDGGKGGNTYKSLTETRKAQYGNLLRSKLKGVPKPKGFGENLSKARAGLGNPAAGTSKYCPVACYDKGKLIKVFDYPFEVNEFFKSKNAWSNVIKVLSGESKYKPLGYDWEKLKQKK